MRRTAPGLALALLALGGCKPAETPAPPASQTLVVAVRSLPGLWQIGASGKPEGFEHDVLAAFAHEAGIPLKVISVAEPDELATKVADGVAHVGLGGLYRLPVAIPPLAEGRTLLWTTGLYRTPPVIVSSQDGYRPKNFGDLSNATVTYATSPGFDDLVVRLARERPSIHFAALSAPSSEALLARVSDGRVDFALVSDLQARLARNLHLGFDVAFRLQDPIEIAWLVADGNGLVERLDAFIARLRSDGTLDRLAHRYFGALASVPRPDAGAFLERTKTDLASWRRLFHEGQEASGLDWRLLAAVAYQESKWDPLATSETGVRGMMQLTEETARHLGVADRLDARESVLAASRYLLDLKRRLPARIAEPDRTWLALAAFNIGLGHLEDARVLAQRQKLDPDLWKDVRQALPLLARPEYYETLKLGYARGGMPVEFVDRVRGYYDILLRHEKPHAPRLHARDTRTAQR